MRYLLFSLLFLSLSVACEDKDENTTPPPTPETPKPEEPKPEEPKPETGNAPTFLKGENPAKNGKWTLVPEFSDEFNGDSLDQAKWCADPEWDNWQWLGRVPGLFQEKNANVKDGSLQIEVGFLEEPIDKVSYGVSRNYTLYGALVRNRKPSPVGYYFECRMKMNKSEMGGGFWLNTHPQRNTWEKQHEIDIQECVGCTSDITENWGKNWDYIMHSNAINTPKNERDQDMVLLKTKNHANYHVYGAWWKSPTEIICFLDGKHVYTLTPPVPFSTPSHIQMSIEYYDWNPIPEDGGKLKILSKEDRTSHYDWVRVWKISEE